MNIAISVALIGALATLIAATVSHFFARRREHQLRNLQFRLERYAEFLGGFAEMGSSNKTYEAHLRIANAVNTMNLIASRKVPECVYELLDYVSSHRGPEYQVNEQDRIIGSIILAIRADLGEKTSGLSDFRFRTISPGSGPSSTNPQLVEETRGLFSGEPSLSEELKRQKHQK